MGSERLGKYKYVDIDAARALLEDYYKRALALGPGQSFIIEFQTKQEAHNFGYKLRAVFEADQIKFRFKLRERENIVVVMDNRLVTKVSETV